MDKSFQEAEGRDPKPTNVQARGSILLLAPGSGGLRALAVPALHAQREEGVRDDPDAHFRLCELSRQLPDGPFDAHLRVRGCGAGPRVLQCVPRVLQSVPRVLQCVPRVRGGRAGSAAGPGAGSGRAPGQECAGMVAAGRAGRGTSAGGSSGARAGQALLSQAKMDAQRQAARTTGVASAMLAEWPSTAPFIPASCSAMRCSSELRLLMPAVRAS